MHIAVVGIHDGSILPGSAMILFCNVTGMKLHRHLGRDALGNAKAWKPGRLGGHPPTDCASLRGIGVGERSVTE